MYKPQKILLVIDPEQKDQLALDKVLKIAKHANSEITLLSCEYTDYLSEGYYFNPVELAELRQEYLKKRKLLLEEIAKPIRNSGTQVNTISLWGHPAYEVIIEECNKIAADLLVLPIERHGAFSRLFLQNSDWQVVRLCVVPTLLVKEKKWQDKPVMLAAVDPTHSRHKPSGLDHKILQTSLDFAKCIDAEVSAIHSYRPTAMSTAKPEEVRHQHKEAFSQLMSDFDFSDDRQIFVEEVPEVGMEKAEAELDVNIVVMGAISRSRMTDVFIGNTTEKVIDFLESDVLVLKPDDFDGGL